MSLLARMHQRRAAKKRAQLVRGLAGIELPSLSLNVIRALNVLRKGDESLAAVGTELVADPNCSVRLLSLANSSAVGLRRSVETVPHAAALLGRDKLEVVLIAAAVSAALPSTPNEHFDPAVFWRRAAKRAAVAREICARTSPAEKMVAFTIALLADMALPLLVQAHGDHYGQVLAQWRTDKGDLCALERDVFGWDHTDVGADLAKAWSLPEGLAAGIGHHHDDEALPAVALVNDTPTDGDVEEFISLANDRFNLPCDDTMRILENADAEAAALVAVLG